MKVEKGLCDPVPIWEDYDSFPEELNSNTKPLFEDLVELEEMANATDDINTFILQYYASEYGYIKQGHDLWHIWSNCLWKQKNSSFEAFCKKELGLKWYQARNRVNASRIASMLLAHGFKLLPKNESMCRVLSYLENINIECDESDPNVRILQVWDYILENYGNRPSNITTKKVREAIGLKFPQFLPKRKMAEVSLEIETAEKLTRCAREQETSVNDLVNELLEHKEYLDNQVQYVDNINTIHLCNQVFLINKLEEVCSRINLEVNSVLAFVAEEDNLKSLLAQGYFKASLQAKRLSLNIDGLAKRLKTSVNQIIEKVGRPEWYKSRDPDGLGWQFSESEKLFYSLSTA